MPLRDFEERMRAWLDARASEMQDDVRALVGVDSYSARHDGVARAAEWVAERFGALGLATEIRRTPDGCPHFLAHKAGESRRVAMVAHLDTVFPEPVPYGGDAGGGGRLRGSGVCDAKGGAVVMLWALRALAAEGLLAPLAVTVLLNGDEEVGSRASWPLVQEVARACAWALVYEPGFVAAGDPDASTITIDRKGVSKYRLVSRGLAAHAGNKFAEGISAIDELAQLVVAAIGRTDLARELTVNAGQIAGGTAANTVPDRAEAVLDVRFRRLADDEAFLTWLREEAARPHAVRPWQARAATTEVARLTQRPPMAPDDGARALAACVIEAGRDLGQRLLLQPRGGGSDAAFTAAAGTPSVDGLGAVGGAMHQPDEWYDPRSLPARAALSAVAIARLTGARS